MATLECSNYYSCIQCANRDRCPYAILSLPVVYPKKSVRKTPHLEYRIHFANGECIIKHYHSDKQAHGHSWVLASQRRTKCVRVELIHNSHHTTNGGSISIISLK